jgi:hypothetical protein
VALARLRAVASELEGIAGEFGVAVEVRPLVGVVDGLVARVRALIADAERRDVPPGSCSLGWGVCPVHGATLVTTEGRSRCVVCGVTWDCDREDQHCREPAAFLMGVAPVCRAHGQAAPSSARLTPLVPTTGVWAGGGSLWPGGGGHDPAGGVDHP